MAFLNIEVQNKDKLATIQKQNLLTIFEKQEQAIWPIKIALSLNKMIHLTVISTLQCPDELL